MSPLQVWALSLVGAVLALAAASVPFARVLDTAKFLRFVERCCREGDWERARKICSAMPKSCVGKVTRHALGLRLEETVLVEGEEAGYRDAPAEVPFAERVRAELAPLARAEIEGLRRSLALALAGGLLAAVSLLRTPSGGLATTVAVVAILAAAWVVRQRQKLGRDLELTMDRLAELVRPGDEMHARPPQPPRREPPPAPPPPAKRNDLSFELTVRGPDGAERTFLSEEPVLKVGRLEKSHLRLDHPDVSRIHAVMENDADGLTLIDLGSAGGTQVNGAPITKAHLAGGDVIAVGPFQLVVTKIGGAPPSTARE